jgi:hypothetical protein
VENVICNGFVVVTAGGHDTDDANMGLLQSFCEPFVMQNEEAATLPANHQCAVKKCGSEGGERETHWFWATGRVSCPWIAHLCHLCDD